MRSRSTRLRSKLKPLALEKVKVDLSKVFEKGQAYVALSRATSLEGLQVLGFQSDKVRLRTCAAYSATDCASGDGSSQSDEMDGQTQRSEYFHLNGQSSQRSEHFHLNGQS